MTARKHITEFLSARVGFVSSRKVHDHLCSLGYQRSSSDGTLSKMAARGEVIRRGEYINSECMLNPDYVPTKASLRQIANHSHLTIGNGLNRARPARKKKLKCSDNGIFDLCRKHSRVYQLIDKPIREVRA